MKVFVSGTVGEVVAFPIAPPGHERGMFGVLSLKEVRVLRVVDLPYSFDRFHKLLERYLNDQRWDTERPIFLDAFEIGQALINAATPFEVGTVVTYHGGTFTPGARNT